MTHWADFRDSGKLDLVLDNPREINYWKEVLDLVLTKKIDAWDCRWLLSCWRQHRLTILPALNLVTNIGFGPDATNTNSTCRFDQIPSHEMKFPLNHPTDFIPDKDADDFTGRIMFTKPGLIQRLYSFVRNVFNGL